MLRQPIADSLSGARSILLAGAGGGYDLIGAVPLFVGLREAGKSVHLASLTFTNFAKLEVEAEPSIPNLAAVRAPAAVEFAYCPEAWLSRWLLDEFGIDTAIWLFEKTGVRPLRRAYEKLVARLQPDAIVLVDGGIDAVLRGDETSIGTPGEDLASLAAVASLEMPATYLACLGMSAELRDGIPHAQFLRRVAQLTRDGGFLGSATLSSLTPAGRAYERALAFITAHQPGLRQSHAQEVIHRAMTGEFGQTGPDVWLSPLLPIYWFFSLPVVASTHLFLKLLGGTDTALEVSAIIEAVRKDMRLQEPARMPI